MTQAVSLRFAFSLFSSLIFFLSCDFKNDVPPIVNQSALGVNSQSCSFNGEVMDDFFKRDIATDLDCLQKNLDLYARVNQVKDPDVLNETELTQFLALFFKNPQSLEKGIKDFFTISHFVLDSPKGLIPLADVKDLFLILKAVNRHGREMALAFDDLALESGELQEEVFLDHRQRLLSAANFLANDLLAIVADHGQKTASYFINDLLAMAWAQKNQKMVADIRSLLFSKLLLLGGKEDIVTRQELLTGISKAPELLIIVYDVVAGQKVPFETERSYAEILHASIQKFIGTLHHEQGKNETYFQLKKIVQASHHFRETLYDLTPLTDSIENIFSTSLFRGENGRVDFKSIQLLLKYVEQVTTRIIRFDDLWELNAHLLERPVLPKSHELVFPPSSGNEQHENDSAFLRLATSHPYFLGKDRIPTYGKVLKRDRRGMIESGVFDYLVRLFLSAHTQHKEKMSKSEFSQILLRYDDFVTEMKLWRNPLYKTVNSNFLMTDLFRQVSTPDGVVDIDEIISAIIMDLTGFRMADSIFPQLYDQCLQDIHCLVNKAIEGVPTAFFYQNFFTYFGEYKVHFPEIYNQVLKMGPDQRLSFIKNLAKFTRHCPFDGPEFDIPIRHKDLVLIMGGMISIEEIYLLMDANHDSILDFEELEVVAQRFKGAIIDFVKLAPEMHFLTRAIFFYLVVYQQMPEKQADILAFYAKLPFMNKAKIKIDRVGVTKIVSFFASPDLTPHPDCFKTISRPETEL